MKRDFIETRGVCSEVEVGSHLGMNRNYHRDTSEEPSDNPLTIRPSNGAVSGEPPVRRSWRPCQMFKQDGEMNPHPHHIHPHAGRRPPRHHRRYFSSQGQSQAEGPVQAVALSKPDIGLNPDTNTHCGQQPRPAVTRYRRHGDPNPRLRGHRRRQPVAEMQASFSDDGPVDIQAQSQTMTDPVTEDRGLPHQTPVAVVTPTHLTADASMNNMQSPPSETEENHKEIKNDCEQEWVEVQEKEEEKYRAKHCADPCSPTSHSSCGKDDIPTDDDKADKHEERVEKDCERVLNNIDTDAAAQKCETTDLCSDTESAASLSMEGPLHSPPPLQSPTPSSSPDAPHFPKMDHFSNTSLSTLPDIDLLEEDDEDCSESCSLSQLTSGLEAYPKTYADFCLESYQKSHPEPVLETQSDPKAHPSSFPEPLKTSYPDLHQPQKQSGWMIAPNESQQTFPSNRHENVQKDLLSSPTMGCQSTRRQGSDQGSLHSPVDRSVGCRLHHYDSMSDGEGHNAGNSPVTKSCWHTVKKAELQEQSCVSVRSTSSEAQEQQDQAEECSKDSGDAITVAIKDIRNAIEEVKIKAVHTHYIPDKPEEPIWVMRQEVSHTEDVQSLQTAASQVCINYTY